MSFDWADYLCLASALQKDPACPGPEEACFRSAISRAYYAAYRRASDFAEVEEGFIPTRRGVDHGRLQDHFRNQPDKTHKKVYSRLNRLGGNRAKADYDSTYVGSLASEAQSAVDLARNLLNGLDSLKETET